MNSKFCLLIVLLTTIIAARIITSQAAEFPTVSFTFVPTIHYSSPITVQSEVHRLSLKYGQNEQLVEKIIACEGRMYPKNTLHYNTNGTVDKGPLQINSVHTAEMEKLGLDINNWQDSLEYGFILLKEEGLSPWSASKTCWSK